MIEIGSVDLQKKINNGDKIIVEFWAEWCGPCRMMKPTFEKVAKENTSDVQMYTMNTEINREIAMSLGIKSIPTVKIFNAGQVVDTKVGVLSEQSINYLLKDLING